MSSTQGTLKLDYDISGESFAFVVYEVTWHDPFDDGTAFLFMNRQDAENCAKMERADRIGTIVNRYVF